jgi:branched-chain amino acid aminotransferase
MRLIALLRAAGVSVEEVRLTKEDVMSADEVFSCGNYGKILPARKIEELWPIGPFTRRAQALYFEFAHDTRK